MTSAGHSYGPTCTLYSESNHFTRRASTISDLPPKVKAQFFYTSALPIDDPLSPLPPPSTSTNSTSSKVPPRPFSVRDNPALEAAWQGLQFSVGDEDSGKARQEQKSAESKGVKDEGVDVSTAVIKDPLINEKDEAVAKLDGLYHIIQGRSKEKAKFQSSLEASAGAGNLKEREKSKFSAVETTPQLSSVKSEAEDEPGKEEATHLLLCDDPGHGSLDTVMPIQPEELAAAGTEANISRGKTRRHRSPFHRKVKAVKLEDTLNLEPEQEHSPSQRNSTETPYGSSPSDKITTGTPFLRAPSRRRTSISRVRELAVPQADGAGADSEDERPGRLRDRPMFRKSRPGRTGSHESKQDSSATSRSPKQGLMSQNKEKESRKAYIPVGISRLHLVELPDLQMKPIYWSPVHDVSDVTRGTWFYKGTMLPVEPDVTIQLEEGYIYNKPWTQTWQDELNSCVEAGAEGEVKAVHQLWPDLKPGIPGTRVDSRQSSVAINSRTPTDDQILGLDPATPSIENNLDPINMEAEIDPPKKFANSGVIYVDSRDAQILRPSLLPSLARGRTPLASIRKGRQIGIAVVRGFDYRAWDKLHSPSKSSTASKAQVGATAAQSGVAATDRQKSCVACLTGSGDERPKVTDLVFVIHGIGQKLSERVESFHFTHAINGFRRQINVELGDEAIKQYLRPDLGGMMVLPINWRSTLTFDDGQSLTAGVEDNDKSGRNHYTLKDITPETIPAVRNLISDVMLDIPYYLSHHKPKMIQAVIKEANRVYRLWCRNNPGFEQTGKVHLIAHSLGSVMAIDILSKQPTRLPKQIDLKSKKVNDNMFEFDTRNLFLCGSPAGFFLLLNKANLLPRKDRPKPDADDSDLGDNVGGDAGTYGCLAVENLYNIMHYNDPIAYRLNAAVDTAYASSLLPATIPTLTSSFFQSLTSIFRGPTSTSLKPPHPTPTLTNPSTNPRPTLPPSGKLPSTIELETHNFSREDLATSRMYALNDNGQLDYYLSSSGGVGMQFQYLDMLGAHSSYWTLRDFVRVVVLECGRGKKTLGGMRAVKRRGKGAR